MKTSLKTSVSDLCRRWLMRAHDYQVVADLARLGAAMIEDPTIRAATLDLADHDDGLAHACTVRAWASAQLKPEVIRDNVEGDLFRRLRRRRAAREGEAPSEPSSVPAVS